MTKTENIFLESQSIFHKVTVTSPPKNKSKRKTKNVIMNNHEYKQVKFLYQRPSQSELAFKHRKINNKIQKTAYQVCKGTNTQQSSTNIK